MYVVGTAGHVDHGKSSLVKALTGIDPDRLKEEKARGMTIDLGFAWLHLPSGKEISLVDVPGHQQFIENMLAGVGAVDAIILVVAADDGVMPQTREHLAIIDLLGISRGVVAVTKTDIIDADLLEIALEEVHETLRHTGLRDSPLVPLSTVTGKGLPEFVAELDRVLSGTPIRQDRTRPRLWIDRCFSIAGFGTVVTGTLIDGTFHVGQEVELLPKRLYGRIRGLQTHKRRIETAHPGTRVAVNLAGLAVEDVRRGDVLSLPNLLHPTKRLDVRIRCLPDAADGIYNGTLGQCFVGSACLETRVRLLDTDILAPGESGLAQLLLEKPTVVLPGDHFVLRRPAIMTTVGGGVVIDPHPVRHRRYQQETWQKLSVIERGTPEDALLQMLGDRPPLNAYRLIERSGLTTAEFERAVTSLLSREDALLLRSDPAAPIVSTSSWLIARRGWYELRNRIIKIVADYHTRNRLRPWMPKEELRSRLQVNENLFRSLIELATRDGSIIDEGKGVRLAHHQIEFSSAEQLNVEKLLGEFERHPFNPPTGTEAALHFGVDAELMRTLVDRGALVAVGHDIYFLPSAFQQMVDWVVGELRIKGSITVAQVRDRFKTSRRYAFALLEHLDGKVTRRVGDERVLLPTADDTTVRIGASSQA